MEPSSLPHILCLPGPDALEVRIGPLLLKQGLKLAVAESCTGGLIGHRVTNVPGSSEYYLGSIVAYAYEAKERMLNVSHNTLLQYGAVSRETVLEMARGIRQTMAIDFPLEKSVGIAVSGVAGPGGGMPNKPVGFVWFGLSTPTGDFAWSFIFPGNRVENKAYTAERALELVIAYLEGEIKE
ncbi:MAG TPA: CinA family protein [Anaerolineaceae bacterium]|nr:CinA family protein [Anaerolineaceae bacterium]